MYFQAQETIELPPYAGSVFRGAFGHALKNMACFSAQTSKGKCTCQPLDGCVYQQLFDPPKQTSITLGREFDVSPPIVIETMAMPECLQAGDVAYIDVVCVGQAANAQWPIIKLALQRSFKQGLGNRHPQRGQAVYVKDEVIPMAAWDGQSGNQHITLLSHARLQHQNQILSAQEWDVKVFLKSLLRRCTLMQEAYDLGLPEVAWDEVLSAIEQVQWQDVVLNDVSWNRWSNRQKQIMPMDGVIGHFVLHQIQPVLLPYLHIGQYLHVGKGSVFGLGQYQMASCDT